MERFALKHANIHLGFLTYAAESEIFALEFEALDLEKEQLLDSLIDYYGKTKISSDDIRLWLMGRITPADLISIDEFLRIAGSEKDNTWEIVKATKGLSLRDNLWLERVG